MFAIGLATLDLTTAVGRQLVDRMPEITHVVIADPTTPQPLSTTPRNAP